MAEQDSLPTPFRISTLPGVQRDGTVIDSQKYTDGVWVRFQRGRPKKMAGYRSITTNATGPIRGVHVYAKQSLNAIHSLSTSKVEALLVDGNGLGASIYDRTPVGFVTQADYLWQADTFFDLAGSNVSVLVAHPGRNINNIDNNVVSPVYFGDVTATTPLTALGQSVDGGVLSIQPYLVLYGSNGLVMNSDRNQVTNFTSGDANTANVASTKIVKGLPIRGAGQSPSAVLWSLNSVIRMSFVGPPQIFRFDTVGKATILSSAGVVEHDGVYYWAGVDRFFMFNGTVLELPNQTNLNWFYDHINYDLRQKVWATIIPRFGEVWWFYPRDGATECNSAVIYNVREKEWYDAVLTRSAGYPSEVFRFPVWADSQAESNGKYALYQHEFGVDKIKNDTQTALISSFTTHDMGLPTGGPAGEGSQGLDRWTSLGRIEPDFVQSEDLSVQVITRKYPKSPDVVAATESFRPETEKVDIRTQGRFLRLKFESNALGGNYESGSTLTDVAPGDARQ